MTQPVPVCGYCRQPFTDEPCPCRVAAARAQNGNFGAFALLVSVGRWKPQAAADAATGKWDPWTVPT